MKTVRKRKDLGIIRHLQPYAACRGIRERHRKVLRLIGQKIQRYLSRFTIGTPAAENTIASGQ